MTRPNKVITETLIVNAHFFILPVSCPDKITVSYGSQQRHLYTLQRASIVNQRNILLW